MRRDPGALASKPFLSEYLRQAGIFQNAVGGMTTDDPRWNREVAPGDGAVPDLVAALSRPHEATTGLLEKPNKPPVESRRHSARWCGDLIGG